MSLKKILVFADYYLPAFRAGGPIRTLASMVEALGDEYEFYIITRDRDVNDTKPFARAGDGPWVSVGKAKVKYLSSTSPSLLRHAINEVDYDLLYVNSFCSRAFSIQVLGLRYVGLIKRRPVILAPRGEFSPNALAFKSFRKNAYKKVGQLLGLFNSVVWQAANDHEEADVRRELGSSARIMQAGDIPDVAYHAKPVESIDRYCSPLKIVFLSRITPMKNLTFALEVLSKVKSDVIFDIYGPVRDEAYWQSCSAMIQKLPNNINARYLGEVEPQEVVSVLSQYALFFLPTLGESFGHVIFEAMLANCAVLISDKTQWRGLEACRAGWDLSLNLPDSFIDVINDFAGASEIERKNLAEAGRKFALHWLDASGVVSSTRMLFNVAVP